MTLPIPDPWTAILLGLAVYRVSRLIVVDSFPPVAALRKKFKYHWPDAGDVVTRPPKRGFAQPSAPQGTDPREVENWRVIEGTSLGYLISCMYCTPFWVALLWWGAWCAWPTPVTFAAVPWALSSAATLLYLRER